MPERSNLPATGLVRLSAILAPRGPIPVSKSTWWAGVKAGRYPQPVKLGPRITAWRVEDIRHLADAGVPPGQPRSLPKRAETNANEIGRSAKLAPR
jgi:prophage regulatory protein